MESKKHKRERWAGDKQAGKDGEDYAKIVDKIHHPLAKIKNHKKNDDPYDYSRKEKGKPKVKVEVKVGTAKLSPRQKELQKKPNTEVKYVPRNNVVHAGRNIGRKLKKILD